MTNLPSLRGALAVLTLAVLLAAGAARAEGMGFFGVPTADEEPSAQPRPAARHHAAAHKPVAHAAAHPSAARQPVSQASAAPSHSKSYAAQGAARPAAARPIALAALPAPKAAAPQPARNSEDEGLVELVEAPRRSYASR
jgi:hypothetical protein